jgi:hypothetical protein
VHRQLNLLNAPVHEVAKQAPSSKMPPLKAKPEVISTPTKDESASDGKDSQPADQAATPARTEADEDAGATFSHTRKHVADRQEHPEGFQRFANTKHNIALINDPKNGPRFTLTKKESGLVDKTEATSTKPAAEKPRPAEAEKAPDQPKIDTHDKANGPSAPSTAGPESVRAVGTAAVEPAAKRHEPTSPRPRPSGPKGVPPAAEPPSKVPVDSSKTFVGPNGTYYDEAWRWMDWRGTKQSWNWPAALTFGHWFAYRRLHGHAAAYAAWLVALAAASVNNVHVGLVTGLLLLTLGLTGLYGNILYFLVFRRAVVHVTEQGEGSYAELKAQLAKAGGVDPKAPWIMGGLTLIGIGLALALTLQVRGGFSFNLWPF